MGATEQTDFRRTARLVPKGNHFEAFEVGRRFVHHWGRTITESDNTLFTTLTLNYNPLYFNAAYAADYGHSKLVVCPMLVFNVTFGLSVEDLSEVGGPFLGVEELTFHEAVHVGDTITASSEVLARRLSEKMKGFGIVTWKTTGHDQTGRTVVSFKRTNLVRIAPHAQ